MWVNNLPALVAPRQKITTDVSVNTVHLPKTEKQRPEGNPTTQRVDSVRRLFNPDWTFWKKCAEAMEAPVPNELWKGKRGDRGASCSLHGVRWSVVRSGEPIRFAFGAGICRMGCRWSPTFPVARSFYQFGLRTSCDFGLGRHWGGQLGSRCLGCGSEGATDTGDMVRDSFGGGEV
jgi:hypothetical protein